MTDTMIDVHDVKASLASPGKGFDEIGLIHGCTYRNSSVHVICPTRGSIHHRVVDAWNKLVYPPNQKRAFTFCSGDEVGEAYNKLIQLIVDRSEHSGYQYVLTLEDDNIPPPDAVLQLLDTIQSGPYDAVSGLYFYKCDPFRRFPLLCGDPRDLTDFKPLDVSEAIERGEVVECNGIPMGCAIWKIDLFKQISAPWFVTFAGAFESKMGYMGSKLVGQDMSFCERARWAGKRFAVDCRVKVGHLDIKTGVVY